MNDRKVALRASLKARRKERDRDALGRVASRVASRLVGVPPLAEARRVGVYLSVRAELPSGPLIDALLAAGHTLAVPEVRADGAMGFRALTADRVPGPLGIPTTTGPDVAPEVLVVPALGWDAAGHRLGMGGGYYDRWLAAHPDVVAIGVGPEDEVVPAIPVEAHDRGVSWLVTESRALQIRRPIRVAAAVWIREGRVFAARRSPTMARPGLWELPGGKVEAGESDADALVRELAEELGVRVRAGAPFGEAIHAYDDVTVHLVAIEVQGEASPVPSEHDACDWLDADALGTVPWAPADVPFLPALSARLRG